MKKTFEIAKEIDISCNSWFAKKPLYVKEEDERYKEYSEQLKERGFCDSETWNFGYEVICFSLPRLKRFREIHNGYPHGMTADEWVAILDKMIFAMEWALQQDRMDDGYEDLSSEDKAERWKKYEEGMSLFSKHLLCLWW